MILPDQQRRPDASQVVFFDARFEDVANLIEIGEQIKALLLLRHGLSCMTCNWMAR